mgnify:CR=1 FL=1
MKGIAGFYYVDVEESRIYECKAKGIFRKEGQKPLVGDLVEIEILDEAEKTGNMTRTDPSGSGQYRSGACDFCVGKSDPEPDASGPFSCDDGTAERSDGNLFQ